MTVSLNKLHVLSLFTPAGCDNSAVSILDRTADDEHLQTYAALRWQSCVSVQGGCGPDKCGARVVFVSCARDNRFDTLTQHPKKNSDLSAENDCAYENYSYRCYSTTTN